MKTPKLICICFLMGQNMFLLELFAHFIAFLAPSFASLRNSARSESMKSAFFIVHMRFFSTSLVLVSSISCSL